MYELVELKKFEVKSLIMQLSLDMMIPLKNNKFLLWQDYFQLKGSMSAPQSLAASLVSR